MWVILISKQKARHPRVYHVTPISSQADVCFDKSTMHDPCNYASNWQDYKLLPGLVGVGPMLLYAGPPSATLAQH